MGGGSQLSQSQISMLSALGEMTKVKGKRALDITDIWDGTPPDLGPKMDQPESGPIPSKTLGLHNDWLRSRNNNNSDDDDYE